MSTIQGEIPAEFLEKFQAHQTTYKGHAETVRAFAYASPVSSLEFQANAKEQRIITTFFRKRFQRIVTVRPKTMNRWCLLFTARNGEV